MGRLRRLGRGGPRWLEVAPEHLDPYVALRSICNSLAADRIPDRRLVIRFEFTGQTKKKSRYWLLIERRRGEVCAICPGDEDLVVRADPERFVRWHMGHLSWAEATADGAINIEGPRPLARAFPRWNNRSHFAHATPQVGAGRG